MRQRARIAAIASALLIMGLGLLALTLPARFAAVVAAMQVPPLLYLAATIRFAMGVSFLLAANTSRATFALLFIGAVGAIGGLVTPIIGRGLTRPILVAWQNGGDGVVRGWGAVATLLGAFALWALLPRADRGDRGSES